MFMHVPVKEAYFTMIRKVLIHIILIGTNVRLCVMLLK